MEAVNGASEQRTFWGFVRLGQVASFLKLGRLPAPILWVRLSSNLILQDPSIAGQLNSICTFITSISLMRCGGEIDGGFA